MAGAIRAREGASGRGWRRVFLALALVNLTTILAGVLLTARVGQDFSASSAHVEHWSLRIVRLGDLLHAASDLGRAESTPEQTARALERFRERAAEAALELREDPSSAARAIAAEVERMPVIAADVCLRAREAAELGASGAWAAALIASEESRGAAGALAEEIAELSRRAAMEQAAERGLQSALTGGLVGRQAWVAVALAGLVIGVTWYGLRIATARQRTADRNVRLIEELEAERVKADCANRSKSEFLANMSHEIRTPMTAILGYADLFRTPNLSEAERLECAQTIRRNGDHLLALINDILDLSKIEAGGMTVEPMPCNVHALVCDVASLMRVRAEEKGLRLDVEFLGEIPETIRTDPTRLRQILLNLLSNAVKFTDSGGARLVVRAPVVRGSAPARMAFEVVDSGVGMSEAELSRLFRPFVQADNSTTRKFGGTGLGLTISKRLAEMLGGGVEVRSGAGEGSAFTVWIGVGELKGVRMLTGLREAGAEDARARGMASEGPVLRGLRVLLAEDGPDNQKLISFMLSKAGAEVEVVENGRDAVERVSRAWEADRPFDVVLMDMQMPVLDGYSAAARLREKGCSGPIIALTAHAMAGDRERCILAGCDDYATKPIDRAKLIAACASAAGRSLRAA